MPQRDTEAFLRMVNEQNRKIAARLEKEAEADELKKSLRGDPVRLQRDAERREKWGQLRAREHMSKRPHSARFVFGRTSL